MVHFGNKQFTEWLLSFDTEKRRQLLTEVQHQLAQMGLRDDQMQRALQQVCQRTEVQVYRLSSEEITMYMQWSSDDYYSRTLRNGDWQGYRRQKYYNQRSQFKDASEYEYLNQTSSYREGYRDHYNWNKYSGSNYDSRPVGRENFKWRKDHQYPLSQKRANEKRRLCYSFDNEDRKRIVSNLQERNYYEEEARRAACLEKLSFLDRKLSVSEGRHSDQKTWKHSDYRKGKPFNEKFKKTLYCDETSAKTDRFNKNQKKQVSDIEKCAKSGDSNANLCTKFRKSDIGVGIDTKSVNDKLTESSKTKTQILNSDISVSNNVVTGTEVPKTQSFHDDAIGKELEEVACTKKLDFDSVDLSCLSSDKGHSLPSVGKSLNSETKTEPSQSVQLTSKSEVKIKSTNEPSSSSEIPSHLNGESSEHNTSISSGDKTLESVLSSTLHCAEDKERVSGTGNWIKDTAGSVRTIEKLPGTTTKKEQTILSSQELNKTNKHLKESDNVKKTSPHCYTTIDEYYNCKLEKPSQKNINFVTSDKSCDTKVPSYTSNTQSRSCEFKTPQSSNNTQSKHCGIKNPSEVSSNIQNKNFEVKTPISTKSNFQQELVRVQGIVGISDFNVLDNISHQKKKENDTCRPVTSKEILFPVPQVKRGTASLHPIEKGLALSDSKPNSSPNNPSFKSKKIPQDTNAALKHGLKSVKSVQRRSSAPVNSNSNKFKRKRCHSYAGEQSKLFGQIDILKKGNAPVSKVKKCKGKEETDIKKKSGNSALKKKKQKKLVPLANKAKPKKLLSQSLNNKETKLPVLKDKSNITESYSSGNLSIKKRKKIRDLFGEEDFEEPTRKKSSNSDSKQSTKQTKSKQHNIADESLVNSPQESDILAKNENHNEIPLTSNTKSDRECPDVINNFSDCIPDTILGTKLIAEHIEVKVEINMETIPLLFPGPQDEIPDDTVRETENMEKIEINDMNDVSMYNKDLATSQSTTSMSMVNGCEKNKQSCSSEANRGVHTLVVQDSTLQSELIISEDTASKSNITKDVPDVEKNNVESPKDIETGGSSDPSKKKCIVTGGCVGNYIQKESTLKGMVDTLHNSDREMTEISTGLTVIPPSSHTGKSLVFSSLSSQMSISDSITGGRPTIDQSGLCQNNEGTVGQSQDQQALTSEHQNHGVINPCDSQIGRNTSELVQQNSILNPTVIPAAPPTYRIRVRDPAYLGIAGNSSNSNPTNVHSSQINCEPLRDKTDQSFSFFAMDKNLQQLAEITYTMLQDRDRWFERMKAANSLTCLTDIKSSEKEYAERDFVYSLYRKVKIYCKLLTNVKEGLRDKTDDTLLCRVNEISKDKKYVLHDVITIKAAALQVERRRLQRLDSNNVPPRLESIHPHLNPNVHTLTPPTAPSQNAITLQPPPAPSQNPISNTVTYNQNSTNINYIPSSSNEFGQIVPQPGHEIASDKTRESASQMQRVNVQNVQNRSNQISGANSVRPPPPPYLQSVERHVQNTAQTNIAGVPAPAYPGYAIGLVPNHQHQNIFQNSANQQNKVHPPGTFHSSIVETTQQNQILPHSAPRSSTANVYQHKSVPSQIGFQNSSSNALYQQKRIQDPSSYRRPTGQSAIPHKQAFPNVEINQQNQVLQQTPFHGSTVRTSSQQSQIPQMGYSSALHPSNQLRDQHLSKLNASQFTVIGYKDMQSAVQNPKRNQRAVRALSAAGSDPIVPSQDLHSFYRKDQQQQLWIQQHLAQNQNLSILTSTYPQIRSQQQLLQFYQPYQKQRQEQLSSQHQKEQFQQSRPWLELGHLQHQPQQQVQMQQEKSQQPQQLLQTKRHRKDHQSQQRRQQEQVLQTQQRHQQEQLLQTQQWHQQEQLLQTQQLHQQEQLLQTQRHQQEQLLQPQQRLQQEQLLQPQQRHQQEQLLQPQQQHQQEQLLQTQQWHQQEQLLQVQQHQQKQLQQPQQQHQQSQLLQHSQEQLKQLRYQQEQLELSQQNQQGLLQQTQHQQEKFQQYLLQQQQLSPPPPLLMIQQQPRNESQMLPMPIRQMERLVYDHANYVRQLQPNSLPLDPPEMATVSTEPLPRSTVHHLPSPNSTSGKRENRQNSLGTGFEMSRSESTNQALTQHQTLLNQPHEHQSSNNIQQLSPMYPPQSNTSTSVIHFAVSESQGQLSGHITSERHKQMSDSVASVQVSRPVPEVVTEQATRVNTMSSDVQENASTECSLNTVANVGKDISVKNVTFSDNNIRRSSESERELTGPDNSHKRRRTSDGNGKHQPPLETEITLKSLLLSRKNMLLSRNEGSATNRTVAQTFAESQITDKSSKQLETTSTLNTDANKVSVVNSDDSIEESNQMCKKPRRNRNENIIADFTTSQKVPHLQTTEKNMPYKKTKTNSPENAEADPTMPMPLQGVSESQDISENCDRISTKRPDIMKITIEPSDFRNDLVEPRNDIAVKNCKKPRKRTRGQRHMPLLDDDVEGLVVRSPLNDCVLIVQEDADIEVIGEYQPQQLRTLSRDSGYTTPTPMTGVIKEDDKDVMFEEEAIKNEDISDNVHYEEIMNFEDQKPNQEKFHDGKLWFETEEMSSSSSDDLLISRIKKEGGGVVFIELDKESSCALCEKTSQVMCSECKSITYCSKTCQIKDWNESHYLLCLGSNNDA